MISHNKNIKFVNWKAELVNFYGWLKTLVEKKANTFYVLDYNGASCLSLKLLQRAVRGSLAQFFVCHFYLRSFSHSKPDKNRPDTSKIISKLYR